MAQHARSGICSDAPRPRALQTDRHLAGLLDRYRDLSEPGSCWTLVIAGDLVDFVGMSIVPGKDAEVHTPLVEEEIAHGLGSAVDHAVHKLRFVARRHDLVFRKLAQFIAAGHRLVLVRGNHDVEFYWAPVRRAFVNELVGRADLGPDQKRRADFESRIEFRHWFYYVEGQLYVEHGHQYDETCSHHHVLEPVSPRDPKRLSYSFSDILQRYIVGPTRGMSTSGHENKTLAHYLRLAFSLGLSGCLPLGYRFARAVWRMFASWRAHLKARTAKARARHERRMRWMARRLHVSEDLLRSIASLWAVPVTGRISSILHSLFLDIVLAVLGLVLLLAGVAIFELAPLWLLPFLVTVCAIGIGVWISRSRVFDPGRALKEGARNVARLLPACFVVMGHTHVPEMESIDENVTYVNLGHWSSHMLDDDGAPSAPCSHLVIRRVDGRLEAEFINVSLAQDGSDEEV